jgi:hypothetical protein
VAIKFGLMALKIKTNKVMNHPYVQYEDTFLWNTIKDAIGQLKTNKDIEIITNEKYIIGFLCKSLQDNGLIPKGN